MEAVSYPYTKHHIGNHRALNEDLEKLKDSFYDHPSNHIMGALSEAVLNHIDRYDMQFSDYYRDWLRVNNVSHTSSQTHN